MTLDDTNYTQRSIVDVVRCAMESRGYRPLPNAIEWITRDAWMVGDKERLVDLLSDRMSVYEATFTRRGFRRKSA